ncbi:hypothetical protein DEJ49_12045 [Streptomyces venezuelae]|uniref:Uncharacterized protein n=1 Tax=Streptomyces venezuelae TaxID=54571 RepID=A0A5P2CHF6_STRVZ|nr:hypothetical protein [Streptomyces venezuelae]QES41647.1 hypothetical protein DEJ49_12045 [Streptomyces venezuelae]
MRDQEFDALMTAITDDPVPDEALRDPAFAAAHAAAVADVALLRERLGEVGDALAADGAGVAPDPVVPLRPPRGAARHRFTVALGAVAATVAAAMVGGLAWLAVDAGQGAGDADKADTGSGAKSRPEGNADADLSAEGFVACSRLIVEGTVTAVDPVPGGLQDRITVDVTRYLKPGSGKPTVTFPMDHDVDPRLKKGDRVLITIDEGSAEPANWAVGQERDRLRTMILKALPASKKIKCDG